MELELAALERRGGTWRMGDTKAAVLAGPDGDGSATSCNWPLPEPVEVALVALCCMPTALYGICCDTCSGGVYEREGC